MDHENLLGLLKVRVIRGINLVVRDSTSSDPYVVVKMGKHKLKTHAIKKSLNPEWNVDLTLTVTEHNHPIRLEVYDKDTFSFDDPMGDAELDINPFMEAVNRHARDLPEGAVINKVIPSRKNCLAEESSICWSEGKVVQDVALRLRGVESGEVELRLHWVSLESARGLKH